MRILPRTKRGTWTLASLVWLGGCLAVWLALPIQPRAVAELAGGGGMIGFTADGKRIYAGPLWPSLPRHDIAWLPGPQDGALRYCDVQTGRCVTTWQPTGREYAVNPAESLALVPAGEGEASAVAVLDLTTGHREVVPWPVPKPSFFGPSASISRTADSQHLVYVSRNGANVETWWWDCVGKSDAGHFPGLEPFDMTPDGHWVTRGDQPNEIAIRAAASDKQLVRFHPSDEVLQELRFNLHSGVFFTAEGSYLVCGNDLVESATGRVCLQLPHGEISVVLPDVQQAITMDPFAEKAQLTRWDLKTGQQIGNKSVVVPQRHEAWLNRDHGQFLYRLDIPQSPSWFTSVLDFAPFLERFVPRNGPGKFALIDARTGTECEFPLHDIGHVTTHHGPLLPCGSVTPDGKTLVVINQDDAKLTYEFWDIPPRKPLSWFAIAAGVWALPIAWFARRRSRKLASGVA